MMINQILNNRYKVIAKIGKGAMGTVYRASDTKTGQDVALKVLVADLTFDADMLERFRREGEALRQLRHPNIVGFVDMFEHDGQQVIVMEYISGGSLFQLIRQGALSLDRVQHIALDLCDALTRAHRLNIIHRDIKPENILLAADGAPRLTDLGVARLVGQGTRRLTGTGTQVGTPFYMSPEAWQGRSLDAQADIWSLGVVIYEMLSGQVPFGGETMAAVMNKVLTAPPPDLKSLRPDVPPDLAKIVRKMLTRDKAKRYQTMREVALDLERAMRDTASQGPTRAARTEKERAENKAQEKKAPVGRALPVGAMVGGALVVGLLVLGGLVAIGAVGVWMLNRANSASQATQTALALAMVAPTSTSQTPAPLPSNTTAPPTPRVPPTVPLPTATDTPMPPTPTEAQPLGPVTITWYVGLGTGSEANQIKPEQAVVDDFNNDPARAIDKINLVLKIVPAASARDTLTQELASGTAPDIVGPVGWLGSNAFYDQWLNLGSLMIESSFATTDFDPTLVKMYATSQGTVGIPFAVYPSALFYNTRLFDRAGLNYPPATYGTQYKMPDGSMVEWSWDTVATVAKLLTLDNNGRHSGQAGFNKTAIAQYGYTWQWEMQPSYVGAFWASGADVTQTSHALLAPGGSPGTYKANIPEAWKAAWQWTYDGMWGNQPFIPNGPAQGAPEFGNGNVFNSGKAGMMAQPMWYTCCMPDVNTWDMAALPSYNGQVSGRMDADTFRIWKGTAHLREAFTVLRYLTGPAAQKLILGTQDIPPAYGAFPGRISLQQQFFAAKQAQFPWVKNWDVIRAGLAYPDIPSAEGWMPNVDEAWNRQQALWALMNNQGGLNLDQEIATMARDLTAIFNK